MKYLTDDGLKLLFLQIEKSNKELERISREVEIGTGTWRMMRRYIDGLEYLIDMEEE